tara:strand:- start:18 stop:206 length:189 start_codon:yes stop_codon:yes gene_type:complete
MWTKLFQKKTQHEKEQITMHKVITNLYERGKESSREDLFKVKAKYKEQCPPLSRWAKKRLGG